MGREAFVAGARRYFADHAWGATTLEDFLVALESTSDRDLRAWSAAWLETTGVSELRTEVEVDDADDPVVTAARLVRTDDGNDGEVLRPHRVVVGGYHLRDGDLVRTSRTEVDLTGTSVAIEALVGQPPPALVLPNDEDWTYAKVVLDERSVATARRSLGALGDGLARALVWSALWNATRDARLPAVDFVDVVARHGPAETHPGVLRTLHTQAVTAIQHYAPASERLGLSERLWEVGAAAASSAPPGSDRQLAWMRVAIELGGSRPDWLRGLLDGRGVPNGLVMDTDLRWAARIELAAADEVDDAELDVELDREDTARTRRWRRTARAARPTADAKDDAWRAVAERDDLANEEVEAVLAGWGRADQRDLTHGFVPTYLASLVGWWSDRTIEGARRLVRGLFPPARDAVAGIPTDEHPTVVAVDDWLVGHEDAPAALRRLVVEQRDDLVRSLRAQAGTDHH